MHPPPNISGSLTIGHVLQLSLEDTLVRWHRMRGFDTLFQPGYDHAGISTWAAIGRTLAKEGREPARPRAGGLRRVRPGLAHPLRRDDHVAVPPRRRLARLRAHALHDGRGLLPRGHPLVRPPVSPRLDLPRQPHLELVPARPNRALRSRARAGGCRRHALVRSATRSSTASGARDDRDRAAGDDPRGRRRSPSTRTTRATATSSARRRSSPSSSVACRSSPTSRSTRSSAPGALKVTPGHDPMDFEIGRDARARRSWP